VITEDEYDRQPTTIVVEPLQYGYVIYDRTSDGPTVKAVAEAVTVDGDRGVDETTVLEQASVAYDRLDDGTPVCEIERAGPAQG